MHAGAEDFTMRLPGFRDGRLVGGLRGGLAGKPDGRGGCAGFMGCFKGGAGGD